MPDVNIICTSSIENDLRFYDVTGNNFLLKIIITDLPSSICAMNYWFGKTYEIDSKIILGDLTGNLALIEFNPKMRGPFRSTSGVSVDRTTWKEFCVVNVFRRVDRRTQLTSKHFTGNNSRVSRLNVSEKAQGHGSPG